MATAEMDRTQGDLAARQKAKADAAVAEAHEPDDGIDEGEKVVTGSSQQLSFTGVGGKSPTGASLTLTGGKFDVDGQFSKGETLRLVLEDADGGVVFEGSATVDTVTFRDKADSKTGQVTSCERQHKARITK